MCRNLLNGRHCPIKVRVHWRHVFESLLLWSDFITDSNPYRDKERVGLWRHLPITESVIMKVEISTCPYNRWIKLIYINCSCIKIEGKAYSAWCIGTNITRARARSHLRVWFHYVQIKHDDSKPIGLPSLAMPLQGTMPPPARASFTWRSIQWKWLPQKSNAPVPLATPGVFRNLDTLWCCRVPVVIL